MTKCEAFKDSNREPDCENEAEYVYYDHKNQSGYPIFVCEVHLHYALEDCYDALVKKTELPEYAKEYHNEPHKEKSE